MDEYALEVLITLAVVMGGYALAALLHFSGPLAMAVAGLLIGNQGVTHAMSDFTRDYVIKFWELVDELLNSVLFLLIGLELIALAPGAPQVVLGLLAIPATLARAGLAVTITTKRPHTRLSDQGQRAGPVVGRPARRHLDRAGAVACRAARRAICCWQRPLPPCYFRY